MEPSKEKTSLSVNKDATNGLVVPQPPVVVVQSTDLVQRDDEPAKKSKVIPFLIGFGYAILFFLPVNFWVSWQLGPLAGLACTIGYLAGAFSVVSLFRKVEGRTGITLGVIKKKEEEETDPEAPPTPIPVPQPVAVTPANPFLHDQDEQQYLRKPNQEEIARHQKLLIRYGLIIFLAVMGPLCGLVLWQSGGDPKPLAGCLIGYLVGVGYHPCFIVLRSKGKLSKLFWMYKDPVVAPQANNSTKAEGEQSPVIEMAPQALLKPQNNQQVHE